MDFYDEIRGEFLKLVTEKKLLSSEIEVVHAESLTPYEVIGKPERDDFPLSNGKEVMIQAKFKGSLGQAFTDTPGNYTGTLQNIIDMPLDNNFERAVFISTINAVLRYLKYISKTVHCRDKEPEECAVRLTEYITDRFGNPHIGFIGMQPAMIEALRKVFTIRVVDLDPDNVGKEKCGVMIEDVLNTQKILSWADLIISTGSTAANHTISSLQVGKPIIFYGVTIAGAAYLQGLEQFCFCGH